MKEHWLTWPYS